MEARRADIFGEQAPEVLSLVSHELTQPLATARGALQTITSGSSELDDGDRVLLLDIALRNLAQLQALLGSLRLFSNVESGDWDLELEPVAVQTLLAEAVENFAEFGATDRLDIEIEAGLYAIVDLTLFRQVLSNIVSNALKFSPPGSKVTISARRERDEVLITIRDQGPGFGNEDAERIFGRSVRLTRQTSGLGLGLYVARAIMDAHEGKVWARSAPGAGAMFYLSVPAAPPTSTRSAASSGATTAA